MGGSLPHVLSLATLPSGELVAGGWFSSAGGVAATRVARWNGTNWLPLAAGLGASSAFANALITRDDGTIVAGGNFSVGFANNIARFDPCLAFHDSYGAGCYTPALKLSASPDPVSTATTGTNVTYAIDDIPDATGSSGVHFGATVISFGGNIPGVDLGIIGAGGCNAHVDSLDVTFAFFGAGSSNATTIAIPPGVPTGAELFVQAVAITEFNLLNPAGLTTSNGVRSVIHAN